MNKKRKTPQQMFEEKQKRIKKYFNKKQESIAFWAAFKSAVQFVALNSKPGTRLKRRFKKVLEYHQKILDHYHGYMLNKLFSAKKKKRRKRKKIPVVNEEDLPEYTEYLEKEEEMTQEKDRAMQCSH